MSQICYIRTRDIMKRPDFKILDMVNEFDLASDEHKQTIQDKKNRHDHLNMLSHEMTSFIKVCLLQQLHIKAQYFRTLMNNYKT